MNPKEVVRFLKNIENRSDNQISVEYFDNADFNIVVIKIVPSKGAYAHADFLFKIDMSNIEYENRPKVVNLTSVYHPNISPTPGDSVCVNLVNDWKKNYSLIDVVQALLYLFYEPNFDDPLTPIRSPKTLKDFQEDVRISLLGGTIDDIDYPPNDSWIEWATANNPELLVMPEKTENFETDPPPEENEEEEVENITDVIVEELHRQVSSYGKYYQTDVGAFSGDKSNVSIISSEVEPVHFYPYNAFQKVIITWNNSIECPYADTFKYYFIAPLDEYTFIDVFDDQLFIPLLKDKMRSLQNGRYFDMIINLPDSWADMRDEVCVNSSYAGATDDEEDCSYEFNEEDEEEQHSDYDEQEMSEKSEIIFEDECNSANEGEGPNEEEEEEELGVDEDEEEDDLSTARSYVSDNKRLCLNFDFETLALRKFIRPSSWIIYQTAFLPVFHPGAILSWDRINCIEDDVEEDSYFALVFMEFKRKLATVQSDNTVSDLLFADALTFLPTSPVLMHLNIEPIKPIDADVYGENLQTARVWRVCEWISWSNLRRTNYLDDRGEHLRLPSSVGGLTILVCLHNFLSMLRRWETRCVLGPVFPLVRSFLSLPSCRADFVLRSSMSLISSQCLFDGWPMTLSIVAARSCVYLYAKLMNRTFQSTKRRNYKFSFVQESVNSLNMRVL